MFCGGNIWTKHFLLCAWLMGFFPLLPLWYINIYYIIYEMRIVGSYRYVFCIWKLYMKYGYYTHKCLSRDLFVFVFGVIFYVFFGELFSEIKKKQKKIAHTHSSVWRTNGCDAWMFICFKFVSIWDYLLRLKIGLWVFLWIC